MMTKFLFSDNNKKMNDWYQLEVCLLLSSIQNGVGDETLCDNIFRSLLRIQYENLDILGPTY